MLALDARNINFGECIESAHRLDVSMCEVVAQSGMSDVIGIVRISKALRLCLGRPKAGARHGGTARASLGGKLGIPEGRACARAWHAAKPWVPTPWLSSDKSCHGQEPRPTPLSTPPRHEDPLAFRGLPPAGFG